MGASWWDGLVPAGRSEDNGHSPHQKDQDLPLESIKFVLKNGGLSLVDPNKLRVKLVSFCVT